MLIKLQQIQNKILFYLLKTEKKVVQSRNMKKLSQAIPIK